MSKYSQSYLSTAGSFLNKLSGSSPSIKTTGDGGLHSLSTSENPGERLKKQKLESLRQHIWNRNWQRKHIEFFGEYRRMVATYPIIKSAIDIYGSEVTTKNTKGDIINVVSDNKKVKELIETCLFKNLKINSRGYLIAREMLKFGNVFGYIVARPREGVQDLLFLPPEAIVREQMYDSGNIDNYRYLWYGGGAGSTFEPWEVVHFKNSEDIETEPYGVSILRSIVDTWRRVVLLREALIIYRLTRAPQRLLFKVATDGLEGEEGLRFAQEVKKEVQQKPSVNPETGEIDFRFNPLAVTDDVFMPTYENSPSDVSVLDGASNLSDVEDYKIIKDDIFAGLKIPKSYLTMEEDLCLAPETLISSLDGKVYSIEEMTTLFNEGKQLFVYSCDNNGNIVPGEVEWCGVTKTVNSLYEIELDNGKKVRCTENHPWLLRNGEYKRADELAEGDSLMPLYKRLDTRNYEEVFHNGAEKWQKTYQLVGETKYPGYLSRKNTVIHHSSFDKLNNHPDYLIEMDKNEHLKLHQELILEMKKRPDVIEKLNQPKERVELWFASNTQTIINQEQEAAYNHKVRSINIINLEENLEVYDLTIKEFHNFALEAGVFVHNSNKAALSEESELFSRIIQQYQANFIEGLLHICLVHLYFSGCSEEEMMDFTLEMNNPSTISEKKKLELLKERLAIAEAAWDKGHEGLNLMSYTMVLRDVLQLTDEEIQEVIEQQFVEAKIIYKLISLRTKGVYEETPLDKESKFDPLTNGSKSSGFTGLIFEDKKTLSSIVKNKLDKEFEELFPKVKTKAVQSNFTPLRAVKKILFA